jgi:hypothetical protein
MEETGIDVEVKLRNEPKRQGDELPFMNGLRFFIAACLTGGATLRGQCATCHSMQPGPGSTFCRR